MVCDSFRFVIEDPNVNANVKVGPIDNILKGVGEKLERFANEKNKHFNQVYPKFESEPRNVRIGLYVYGFIVNFSLLMLASVTTKTATESAKNRSVESTSLSKKRT
ncbi:hypothetical protein CR513_56762, partial [Mucuna pruriens]